MKANLRQQLFAEAWLATEGNGTESARRAGYRGSTNTLAAHASTLIRNPKVRALISARTEELLIKVHRGASPEAVIQELSDQMYGRKPARWKVKDQQYDAQGAATTLGRLFRMHDRRTVPSPSPPNHLSLLLHRIRQSRRASNSYGGCES
jgi:terminase small subunit-like protein